MSLSVERASPASLMLSLNQQPWFRRSQCWLTVICNLWNLLTWTTDPLLQIQSPYRSSQAPNSELGISQVKFQEQRKLLDVPESTSRKGWPSSDKFKMTFGKLFFFLIKKIIHERHRERGRDIGRGRSKLLMGTLMWDLISGPWDHNLSQRPDAQPLSHPGALKGVVLITWLNLSFAKDGTGSGKRITFLWTET